MVTKHGEPPADLPHPDDDDDEDDHFTRMKKHHHFRLSMRTRAITFEGTADVYGDGTLQDAEQYLRAMLAQPKKASPLHVEPIKGKVITVEARRE